MMHPSKTTHGHPTAAGSSVTSPNANNTDHHQTPPNYTLSRVSSLVAPRGPAGAAAALLMQAWKLPSPI